MQNCKKVQCISTECGIHEHLRLGAWYEPQDRAWNNDNIKDKIVLEHHHLNKYGVFVVSQKIYDKSLFRTVSERRDSRLSKLLTK